MNKLVVISSDAMVGEDLNYLKTLPNFNKFFSGCAQIINVKSIYPSVTFPAHVSMMTGMFPNHHGVFSNMQLLPGSNPTPWQWEYSFMKCRDIFYAAKSEGLKTASVFWPVTAGNPSIDYHIADNWSLNGESTLEAFIRAGANKETIDIIKKYEYIFHGKERSHPQRDEFGIYCASDIIRKYSPDLLLVHPANIDAARHDNGVFGPHIEDALKDLDRWIGILVNATIDSGHFPEYNFVLVSDHGQMDVRRNIGINVLLAENGFIKVAKNGLIQSWDAWCLSNGMSALVFIKDKNNRTLYNSVYNFLKQLKDKEVYGISKIFTEEECNYTENFGGPFSFVLETDGYTSFGDYYTRPLVRNLDNNDYRFGKATHGYLPEKGPQPVFLAKGPAFKENIMLYKGHIIDEAPTYAKVLGIDLGNIDGSPINEILN